MEIITYTDLEHNIKNNKMIYVKQVRHTLKHLKLDSKGKKADLIRRLYTNYTYHFHYVKHMTQ